VGTGRAFTRRFVALAGAVSVATAVGLSQAPSAHAALPACAGPFKTEGPNLAAIDYTHGRIGAYTFELTGPTHRVLTISLTANDRPVHIQFNGIPKGSYLGKVTAPSACAQVDNMPFNVSGK